MKRRCMCGKPDTMEYGIWQDIEFDNLLHFKSADRECEQCGRPLCKDCGYVDMWKTNKWHEGLLCPACITHTPSYIREQQEVV